MERTLYVNPPPLKFAVLPVRLIVDVPAFNVSVAVAIHEFPVPDTFSVDAPNVKDREFELLELICEIVTVLPLVSRAPFVSVNKFAPVLNASAHVQPPPTPLNTTGLASTTELQVIVLPVLVALYVSVPVYVRVIAAPSRKLPPMFSALLPAHVPVNPSQSKSAQALLTFTVSVTAPLAAVG